MIWLCKDGFLAYIKTGDIYKDIVEDVDTRFDLSNYELDRPLTKRKNKKAEKLIRWENYGKMYFTEELIRLLYVQMMKKECNTLIWVKHAYGTFKDLVSEEEEIKCNNVIKQYKND